MFPSKLVLSFSLSITFLCLTTVESTTSTCANTTSCFALGSYSVWSGATLTFISTLTNYNNNSYILSYNPQINESLIQTGSRINIPFSCGCIGNQFLGHVFQYTIAWMDSYTTIADTYYASLTTAAMLEQYNSYGASLSHYEHYLLNVTVKCSCGNTSVSNTSAVFVTYPLRVGDSLDSIATDWNVSMDLLHKYNPGVNFSSGSGLVYIPDYNSSSLNPDSTATAPTATSSPGTSLSGGLIAGISLGAVMGVLLVAVCIYCGFYRQKEKHDKTKVSLTHESELPLHASQGSKSDSIATPGSASPLRLDINEELAKATNALSNDHKTGQGGVGASHCVTLPIGVDKCVESSNEELAKATKAVSNDHKTDCIGNSGSASPRGLDIIVAKSVEFSYEELAKATKYFIDDHKIGQGGFGTVYRAELRNKKAAIKKMDMTATKEFKAEVTVLTRVNHVNVVNLIGYCQEHSLCLVYDYIENGNLRQHLDDQSGKDPLPWATRLQIAIDSARGLLYLHHNADPPCIHRDIKPENILLDKKFGAKVADFGLTRLTEVGGSSKPTLGGGTHFYMPPECRYSQQGNFSPKVDVYAFGVVLYELISPKEVDSLVAMFEEFLSKESDPRDNLRKIVDPRLGDDDYDIDSVLKMARLAAECTQQDPEKRPKMSEVVSRLRTLSNYTGNRDVGSYESKL